MSWIRGVRSKGFQELLEMLGSRSFWKCSANISGWFQDDLAWFVEVRNGFWKFMEMFLDLSGNVKGSFGKLVEGFLEWFMVVRGNIS